MAGLWLQGHGWDVGMKHKLEVLCPGSFRSFTALGPSLPCSSSTAIPALVWLSQAQPWARLGSKMSLLTSGSANPKDLRLTQPSAGPGCRTKQIPVQRDNGDEHSGDSWREMRRAG